MRLVVGKTTIVSRIVDHLKSQMHQLEGALGFYYFKHDSVNGFRQTLSGLLRALLVQLLYQDDALLEYMHQKCAAISKSDLLREPFLKELMKGCLMSQKKVWIVLDGLDECADATEADGMETRRIIQWFQQEIFPRDSPQQASMRLLISGQRDGCIDSMLTGCPTINLEATDQHMLDVEHYTKARALQIKRRFALDSSEEAELVEKVVSTAKGTRNLGVLSSGS
jgi:hypothetical protein